MSVDVRYPCYYPASLQHEKLLLIIIIMYYDPHLNRLLFVELAFVGSGPEKTIEKKIRFYFYKVLLLQFLHYLNFYAIFYFVNWQFLNSSEFKLGPMY